MIARRLFVGTLATGIALVGAGSAAAYLNATGSGSGTGSVSVPRTITISAPLSTSGLVPGAKGDLKVRLANTGSSALRITSIGKDAGITISSDKAGCGAADLSFTGSGYGPYTVAAGSQLDLTLTDAVTLSPTAANACQGATFTVPLKTS